MGRYLNLASLALISSSWALPSRMADACSPLEIVSGMLSIAARKPALKTETARGTGEPASPQGMIVGAPLLSATRKLIPGVTMHNVAYPAGMTADSKTQGVAKTLSHMQAQAAACPNQKFVLVGYSQGADVMHNAAAKLPEALHPRVVAVVMFGDPGNMGPTAKSPLGGTVPVFPKALANRLMENCAKGDPVCGAGSNIMAHLTYGKGSYMSESAKYIQKQFKSGGTAGPNASALARGEAKG